MPDPSDPCSPAASAAWRRIGALLDLERRRAQQLARELDLSPPQLLALRQLDPDEPRPMGQLACAMTCDNSNVTGLVNRLEKRGLVERLPAAHDRRVRMLALTPEGVRVRAAVMERWSTPPAGMSDVDADELDRLTTILDRIVDAADEEEGPPTPPRASSDPDRPAAVRGAAHPPGGCRPAQSSDPASPAAVRGAAHPPGDVSRPA